MQSSNSSSPNILSQLVNLAVAVGEVREHGRWQSYQIRSNSQRIAKLETQHQSLLERHPVTQPMGSQAGVTETESLSRKLSRWEEIVKVLLTIYRIWRIAPWGLVLFGIAAAWRWAWPAVLRWLGLS